MTTSLLTLKVSLSESIFDAMNQILGNEHTTNPPLIVDMNVPNIVISNTATDATEISSMSMEPVTSTDPTDDSDANAFHTGQKIKPKKGLSQKQDLFIDLMMKKLEVDDEEKEVREKREVARDEREQKLVDIIETLTKYITHTQN